MSAKSVRLWQLSAREVRKSSTRDGLDALRRIHAQLGDPKRFAAPGAARVTSEWQYDGADDLDDLLDARLFDALRETLTREPRFLRGESPRARDGDDDDDDGARRRLRADEDVDSRARELGARSREDGDARASGEDDGRVDETKPTRRVRGVGERERERERRGRERTRHRIRIRVWI